MSLTLWTLGYLDQALQRSHADLTLVRQLSHPYSLALMLTFAAVLHQFRKEVRTTLELAEAIVEISTEQGFPYWLAKGRILQGWACMQEGWTPEGVVQIRRGIEDWRTVGGDLYVPYYLSLLVETSPQDIQPGERLHVLDEALMLVEKNEERWCKAELYRLKGELLLQLFSDNHTEAVACFQQALDVAQSQQAKSWELRAATSLARLWQQQGKRQEAHDLLGPVYNWFTEGFDTADLKDAKALLDELA
jgi:predicted ATPase